MIKVYPYVDAAIFTELAECGYYEFPELRVQTLPDFLMGALDSLSGEAMSVVQFVGTEAVAMGVIDYDRDPHVGPCCSIQWNYCKPEYRKMRWGFALRRTLRQVGCGLPLAYTHRTQAGTYLCTYLYDKTKIH